jgi:hypothetical protein
MSPFEVTVLALLSHFGPEKADKMLPREMPRAIRHFQTVNCPAPNQ